MDMHIYTREEYEIKQKERALSKINEPFAINPGFSKTKVVKNYIYYDEPFRIK